LQRIAGGENMAKEKELIIANLRKQAVYISKMPANLKQMSREIDFLIEQLEDESKTGTPPDYNLGSQQYGAALKKLVKELNDNIKILRGTGDFIMLLQKDKSGSSSIESQEFDK